MQYEQRLSTVEAKVCKLEDTDTLCRDLETRLSKLETAYRLAPETLAKGQQSVSEPWTLDAGKVREEAAATESGKSQSLPHPDENQTSSTAVGIVVIVIGTIAALIIWHMLLPNANRSVEVEDSIAHSGQIAGEDSGCWGGVFTWHLCCDLGHGPYGVQKCWTSEQFTFETCCVEARCRRSFFANFSNYQIASSRLVKDIVVAAAGNPTICSSVGGDLHYAMAVVAGRTIARESDEYSSVAFCAPSTCADDFGRVWVAMKLLSQDTDPQALKVIDIKYPLPASASVDHALPFAMALLVAICVVLFASAVDICVMRLRSIFLPLSLRWSVHSLLCVPVGNMLGVDVLRVFATMYTVASHSSKLLTCEEFAQFRPAWLGGLRTWSKWSNACFIFLSGFTLAYSLSQFVGSPACKARWLLHRLARSYMRQVPQCILGLITLVIVMPSMPLHHDETVFWWWSNEIAKARHLWNSMSLHRLLSWGFSSQDRFYDNEVLIVGQFESQWLLLVFLLYPMSAATALVPNEIMIAPVLIAVVAIVAKLGDLWFWRNQSLWKDEVGIGGLRTPAELFPAAVVGFAIGLLYGKVSWKWCWLKVLFVGTLGVAIIALPLSADLNHLGTAVGIPGVVQYEAFTAAWTLAPVLCFSIGYGFIAVALCRFCWIEVSDARPKSGFSVHFVPILSRLSLGMMVNHWGVMHAIQAFGLRNQFLPCSGFVYVVWCVTVWTFSAFTAALQWCLLEAPLSAVLGGLCKRVVSFTTPIVS